MADSPFLSLILERINSALQPLAAGRVLAAVSGGADSLALLRVLLGARLDVVAAHVNHQMRGAESDGDEAYVRELCAQIGVPFDVRRVQVLADSNIEAQARALRYAALEEMALANDCRFIATGHTANDNLETILLHWLRGAMVSGMRGIQAERALRFGSPILVARPLLDVTRGECEAICVETGWNWRQDSSNVDSKYLRNRVRRELVPLLENLMAAPRHTTRPREHMARQTTRAARLWADDLDLLDDLARAQLEMLTTRRDAGLLVLDGDKFRALPLALQRRVLRLGALEAQGEAEGEDGVSGELSSRKIEEARAWIGVGGARRVWQWKKNLRVEWCGPGSGNRIRLARVEFADTQ